MDLGFLDKSTGVTPLLVRLYDNHKLYMLAQDRNPAARAELTNVVSELLQMPLSARESELIADVLIALIRQTQKDMRQALAEKLACLDQVPLRVILNLADDEIEVAGPVLRNSSVLTDMDLIYIIKSKGQETWPCVASRVDLSDTLINILSQTRDFDTALSLIKNNNIVLTETALHILSDLAQGNEVLATPFVSRNDVPLHIARKIYQSVGGELKSFICAKYEVSAATFDTALEHVIVDFVEAAALPKKADDIAPSDDATKMAARLKDAGELNIKYMLSVLKNNNQIPSFVALFSAFSDISVSHVIAMLKQPSAQSFAITCKALKIAKPDFVSLYLLTSRLRSPHNVTDVYEITKAIAYFDALKSDAAAVMIDNFRKNLNS